MELIQIGMAAITRVVQLTASVTANCATMDPHLTDNIISFRSMPFWLAKTWLGLLLTNQSLHAKTWHRPNYWCRVYLPSDAVLVCTPCLLGSRDSNEFFYLKKHSVVNAASGPDQRDTSCIPVTWDSHESNAVISNLFTSPSHLFLCYFCDDEFQLAFSRL